MAGTSAGAKKGWLTRSKGFGGRKRASTAAYRAAASKPAWAKKGGARVGKLSAGTLQRIRSQSWNAKMDAKFARSGAAAALRKRARAAMSSGKW